MVETAQLAQVKLLVCDVDGVLTDGAVIYGSGTVELKVFSVKDGLATTLAGWSGLPVVWLTGRASEAVARRADELGVHVYQSARDKGAGVRRVADEHAVPLSDIAYLGDDLNDLPALRLVGLPLAVADAAPEVAAIAHFVTSAPGGHGAVREVIEYILRGQHRWDAAVHTYLENLRTVTMPGQ
jgi:3-deoxy-D-manno-octulosonate 8-phosphate phosphatase (KDO 8-P phosphatase)